VQVEIWSDVVCPWCYIGKRRFEEALSRFAHGDEVEVTYRAFQLDPTAKPGVTMPVAEAYARKFGGPDRAAEMIANITGLAAAEGLEFHLERAQRANTLLAHRLLWFAERRGMQGATKEALLRAYFTEGHNVADPDELAELAAGVGLERDEVKAFLATDEGLGEVMEQMAMAASAGITAVPTYVFDGKWAVPGAQDPDTFLRVLTRVAELERAERDDHAAAAAAPAAGTDGGATCEDDVCAT
jgi:predicted DsbA family dithiol-disulfide isomerase